MHKTHSSINQRCHQHPTEPKHQIYLASHGHLWNLSQVLPKYGFPVLMSSSLGLPKAYPKPAALQRPAKAELVPLRAFSAAWLQASPGSWAMVSQNVSQGRSLSFWTTSSWQAKHVGKKGVRRVDSGPLPTQKIHQWQLQQQCFRLTKVTCHGLVSPSSTGKICPFFPQLQRKNNGHPPPPRCWAVFYSQKEDLSMS